MTSPLARSLARLQTHPRVPAPRRFQNGTSSCLHAASSSEQPVDRANIWEARSHSGLGDGIPCAAAADKMGRGNNNDFVSLLCFARVLWTWMLKRSRCGVFGCVGVRLYERKRIKVWLRWFRCKVAPKRFARRRHD